jgi:predicted kinase
LIHEIGHRVPPLGPPSLENGHIATLILLNGPPGVGKSTLARRYVDEHPLALLLEIDAIRVSLGCWHDRPESKLIARGLALAMAEAHMRTARDVIVPQYLGRMEFIAALDSLARRVDADFREVVLLDSELAVVERFRDRRVELAATAQLHPQADVSEPAVAVTIAEAFARLDAVVAERPRTVAITRAESVDETYRALLGVLEPPPA